MFWGSATASPRCRHIHIGSAKIYSEVVGSGSPVVLIHGLAASTRWWEKNVSALARDHEVHSIDLVGSGRSGGSFVLREAASILATWMERCDLGRAALIGHSMGGHIAADLAAAHPHLIDRLVLVDAAIQIAGTAQAAAQRPGGLSFLPVSILPLVVPEALRTGLPKLALAAYDMSRHDMGPTLQKIRARSLVIWGERDPMVPLSIGYTLASMLPGKALVVVRGAGHVPMWEQPAAFNKIVTTFLSSRDGSVHTTPTMH
ncbi:MAG: alpha/beta hydrolase [Chloroflexales bacterium]|nr:alpha/beta hydrolase [Chloroflexales bacterium]